MRKKAWNDPVWSAVIAGLMLLALSGLFTYFFNLWPLILDFLHKTYNFVISSTGVPNWLLGIFGVLSLPYIFLVFFLIKEKLSPSPAGKTDWRTYQTDIFYNLRWRWHYLENGNIHNLVTFCSYCDFQVYPRADSAYHIVNRIEYECESCGKNWGNFEESPASLEDKVKRFIQQKIRNGKWELETQN